MNIAIIFVYRLHFVTSSINKWSQSPKQKTKIIKKITEVLLWANYPFIVHWLSSSILEQFLQQKELPLFLFRYSGYDFTYIFLLLCGLVLNRLLPDNFVIFIYWGILLIGFDHIRLIPLLCFIFYLILLWVTYFFMIEMIFFRVYVLRKLLWFSCIISF
jgi:hypothetical protein